MSRATLTRNSSSTYPGREVLSAKAAGEGEEGGELGADFTGVERTVSPPRTEKCLA